MLGIIKNWYIERVKARIDRHFTCNFQRIERSRFIIGECRYNYRCFNNAAHHAIASGERTKVYLVYCRDNNGFGFLHVINQLPNGTFQDNTLGYDFETHSYYLIKRVHSDCYCRMGEWFHDLRVNWLKMAGRYWLMRLLGIQPIDVF